MADNKDLAALTGNCIALEATWSGDTAVAQGVAILGASGSEGSWTLAAIPGDATNGLLVNLGANNDITGTVTANLSATDNAVLDSIAALLTTIDADTSNLSVVGGGTEATAIRVTLASDSTGVVSIDDNAGSLTVDNAGTFAVQVDGNALTALQLIDNTVYVDDADWTALTSSHNLIGGIYQSTPGTITDGDTGPLRLTANGAVHVSDAGGSLTIDNSALTSLAAAINSNRVDVNIAANALNSSTIQDDAAFTLASSYVTAVGAIRDDSLSTLTAIEGDAVPLRVSSTGALHVTGGGGGTEYSEDDATPATIVGTATLMERDDALSTVTPIEGDWIGFRGTAEGALWTQDFNSDTMVTHLATLAGAVSTEMQVDVVGSLPAGTNAIGKLSANSGVDIGDVDVTSISAGSNLIGDVGLGVRTSGGTTPYYNNGAATLASIKASAGQIYTIEATNKSSTLYYLQLFNLATGSVTLGTTVPTNEYIIPHNSGNGGGIMRTIPVGRAYGTAISYAITTTKGGATTGTADDVLLNVDYA